MKSTPLRRAAALGFFVLPVFCDHRPAQADAYYASDSTIAAPITGNAYIGKSSSASTTPYSPLVDMTSGGSVPKSAYVYNGSRFNLKGGKISASLNAYHTSTVNVSGGTVASDVNAYHTCAVNVSGGTLSASLNANNACAVTISAGSVAVDVNGYDNATVTLSGAGSLGNTATLSKNSQFTMTGGTVGSNINGGVYGSDSSNISVSGGVINGNLLSSGGSITFSGGSVSNNLTARSSQGANGSIVYSGGSVGGYLYVYDTATLNITTLNTVGLTSNATFSSYSAPYTYYIFSGYLASNGGVPTLNKTVRVQDGAHFLLNGNAVTPAATPAPGSLLVSLAGIAGAGLGLRRRR